MKGYIFVFILSLLAIPASQAADAYGGKYTPCLDYYTVGPSHCGDTSSAPAPDQPPALLPPPGQINRMSAAQSPADEFLSNYGKPPREFAEFYTNPTQENALRWVKTYNDMLKRSQTLGQQWSQADNLYQQAQQAGGPSPLPMRLVPSPSSVFNTAPLVHSSLDLGAGDVHLGAFADQDGLSDGSFDADNAVHILYYFSANCPFCARMTPQLLNLYNEMSGKLTLTCVDVTPISATGKPDHANIIGKLPCAWRLPEEGEVARENVQQTPTMVLSRGGKTFKRVEGYIPLAELQASLGPPTP